MLQCFQESFSLRIEAGGCSVRSGYDPASGDTWYYKELFLRSGNIYGIVSEYGQGCAYVSALLGGKIPFDGLNLFCNDTALTQSDLRDAAWNLEPACESYGKKHVRRAVEQALQESGHPEPFETVAQKFLLTPERFDRKFIHLSGERWRAASALGYAQNRKIYFAPYKPSMFYYQMCQSGLLTVLQTLKAAGALVILPAGSDTIMKHIADEIIYIDPPIDLRPLC